MRDIKLALIITIAVIVLTVAGVAIYDVRAYLPIVGIVLLVLIILGAFVIVALGIEYLYRRVTRFEHIEVSPYGSVLHRRNHMQVIAPYHPPMRGYFPTRGERVVEALPPEASRKPQVEDLVCLVERNSLQVPLGKSLKNQGETVIVDLTDVHVKIIGSSRKGKSCLAAAIIDIVSKTHDADLVRIALLDLENKTSKLFESVPHLCTLTIAGKPLTLHARNPQQVADYLHVVRELMDHRYSLSETQQEAQPHILVYLEEFLSLKRHSSLSTQIRARLIDDLNELAIRGLKVRIHLMCCAQVDYADDELKAFANNFGLNISFSVRPEAARAAGLLCHELLAENYRNKVPGQFVVEGTGCTDLVDAPDYNVTLRLKELSAGRVLDVASDTAAMGNEDDSGPRLGECLETITEPFGTRLEIGINPLADSTDVTSDERLDYPFMDEVSAAQFVAGYRIRSNVDFNLNKLGLGSRYRQHARALIKEHRL